MSSLRHRQLLLSLKSATIEACFSVPMLQLTLGHMPFAIGFAVAALGWGAAGVGFLAATPFVTSIIQLPISYALQRFLSLRTIARAMFVVNAVPWFLVVLFPWLTPESRDILFAAITFVSALGNAVCSVAWAAAMSELVPLQIRGRFFGRRNMIYGFWTLVVLLAAGRIADWTKNSLLVLGIVYAVAALARLVGLHFFSRMTFPPAVTTPRHETLQLGAFVEPFKNPSYRRFLIFNGLLGMFLLMGMPFYNVFVLRELSFSLGDLTVMTTVANLAGLVSVNTWGPLTDRFGVKPVITWSVAVWATTASLLWLLTGPERRLLAYPSFFIYGFMWTLIQLLQLTFMLKMAPAGRRTYFISTYYASTYLLTFLGPFAGGWLLRALPSDCGHLLGLPLTRYHLVFVGSLVLCLATLPILRRVVEPQAGSLRAMVRHMSSSAELNPFLMLVTLAQQLFGGRAFETLVRESKRTLRKQGVVLADVGEELAQESWRALRRPFQRPPSIPDDQSDPEP
jgi:hypothetical protein